MSSAASSARLVLNFGLRGRSVRLDTVAFLPDGITGPEIVSHAEDVWQHGQKGLSFGRRVESLTAFYRLLIQYKITGEATISGPRGSDAQTLYGALEQKVRWPLVLFRRSEKTADGGIAGIGRARYVFESFLSYSMQGGRYAVALNDGILPRERVVMTIDKREATRARLRKLAEPLRETHQTQKNGDRTEPRPVRLVPPAPPLVVGRKHELLQLKSRLIGQPTVTDGFRLQALTALRGWPGVGKSTIAAALAHDEEIARAFPDGILWSSLQDKPDAFGEICSWARALGVPGLEGCRTAREAAAALAPTLRDRRMLLIVDDVWAERDVIPFRIGGPRCSLLVITRDASVARSLATTEKQVYVLGVLSESEAVELLETVSPDSVCNHRKACLALVRELQGLPLALQVAGRLLNAEASYGFGIEDLVAELRDMQKILEAQAPAGFWDSESDTSPSVAALLRKSTDRLDALSRERYSLLGAFPPKPGSFDLAALKSVWATSDPAPTLRKLLDRGLVEHIGAERRYRMHSLLIAHARSLWAANSR